MNPQGHELRGSGHEARDVDVMNLLLIAGVLLLMIGLCLLICLGLFRKLADAHATGDALQTRRTLAADQFPEPRLLVTSGKEFVELDRAARLKSSTYGWMDKARGEVRIPIARAMELLVERGLPEVGAGQTRLQLMQSRSGAAVETASPTATPVLEREQ